MKINTAPFERDIEVAVSDRAGNQRVGFLCRRTVYGSRQWAVSSVEEEGTIDLFDMDTAVLHGFDAVGDFDQLSRRRFRVG
jgi:hypothetical protein